MPTACAVAPGRRLDDSALSLCDDSALSSALSLCDDSFRATYNVRYRGRHLECKGLCTITLKCSFPDGSDSKESACNAGDPGSITGSGREPLEKEWLHTPVFLPREFRGQRSLVGYSPQGCKESDTTE